MIKQFFLIFSTMVIVFSLMLIFGGFTYVFIIAPSHGADKYIQTAVSLTILVGLAGLFSGLVGMICSVVLKAAEVQEARQQAVMTAEPDTSAVQDPDKTAIFS